MATLKNHFCVAYGGASALCPPGHTMEAVRKGIELGVAMTYVEVRVTRDGEMLAWPSKQRLVGEEAVYLDNHRLAEWRRLTEDDPAPLLMLEDVLELVSQTNSAITIDVRDPGIESALAKMLRKYRIPYESLLVLCPSDHGRSIMHSMDPKIPLGHRFQVDEIPKITPDFLKQLQVDAVVWPFTILTPELVKRLKAGGIAVYAGAVHLAEDMRRLRGTFEVDGIVTTYPELLIKLFESKQLLTEKAA